MVLNLSDLGVGSLFGFKIQFFLTVVLNFRLKVILKSIFEGLDGKYYPPGSI